MFGLIILFMCCQTKTEVSQTKTEVSPQWASDDLWTQWSACVEASCRSEVLGTQFIRERLLVPKWINLIEEPEEQLLQLNKLLTDHPGKIQALCSSFRISQVQKKCSSSAARPHLYTKAKTPQFAKIPKRRAPGPNSSQVFLPIMRDSPLLKGSPKREVCARDVDPRSCLHRKALNAAQKRDSVLAAQYCQAISNTHIRWRWECHFKVAEMFVSNHETQYRTAADHCFLAKEYSGRCIVGLHHRLAERVPPADSNAEGWSDVLEIASEIEEYWGDYEKKNLQREIRDSFWGIILLKSYQKAEKITGDPLEYLPEHSHPHIYAAAAFNLIQQHREVKSLEQLLLEVQQLLENRSVGILSRKKKESRVLSIDDFWMRDKTEDIDIPAIGYLGRSRRTYSEDKDEELSICILEAAARKGGYWVELLEKERDSEQMLLQWTARRLLNVER